MCNGLPYHVKATDDGSPITENNAVLRWLLVHDAVLLHHVAAAVGEKDLILIAVHYEQSRQWFKAAQTKWAQQFAVVRRERRQDLQEETLQLLEKCGAVRTTEMLQLELDVLTEPSYASLNPRLRAQAEKTRVAARIAELASNNFGDPSESSWSELSEKIHIILTSWVNDSSFNSLSKSFTLVPFSRIRTNLRRAPRYWCCEIAP